MTQVKSKRIRTHIPEIKLPDDDNAVHTIIGKHILFVSIEHDQDAANPCEDMDGFGEIRSLSNRHINRIDYAEAKEMLESDEDVIPLSYFEHGNSMWMVMNSPAPAGVEFQWDGVRFAGIWIPDKYVRESYTEQDGLSRRDWMVQQAKSACETYTQWCNGEVYGYNVEAYLLRKDDDTGDEYTDWDDYRFKGAVAEDSCWGFFGWDYARGETIGAIRSVLGELGFSKRAVSKVLANAV